jgi:8-oxo-dGTP pyrophosphatase MutT (NUDIX family)
VNTSNDAKPIRRPAARVLLISDQDRVLLFRWVFDPEDPLGIWITPGGGLHDGETFEQAARRELWEETGLADVDLGPRIWNRQHVFDLRGTVYEAVERFFLVRTREFDPVPAALDPAELADLVERRWWSLDEMVESSGHETFVPRSMADLLRPILAGEVPDGPIEVGI